MQAMCIPEFDQNETIAVPVHPGVTSLQAVNRNMTAWRNLAGLLWQSYNPEN